MGYVKAASFRDAMVADPVLFAGHVLGVRPWLEHPDLFADQIAVFRSIFANRRTAVPSGHKTGKTFTAAVTTLTYLLLYPGAKVITTAPTDRQVRELLWQEIHRIHGQAKCDLGGELLDLKYRLGPGWFAIGFSTDKRGQGVQAQGWSGADILLILDEAAGIPRELWNVAETSLQSPNAKIVALGNPVDPSTEFYNACKSPLWHTIKLSSRDTANARAGRQIVPGLASIEWCDEMLAKWGAESPEYQFRVLGNFPDSSSWSMISLAMCQDAITRQPLESGHIAERRKLVKCDTTTVAGVAAEMSKRWPIVGVDVARFGDDQTVIVAMTGKVDTPLIVVDDTGVGGGVTDQLNAAGLHVLPVNFGEEAGDRESYADRATEMYAMLADDLRLGVISGFPDDETVEQLTNRRYDYKISARGFRRKLESKDKYKERHGRSPDEADALMLANFGRHVGAGGAQFQSQIYV